MNALLRWQLRFDFSALRWILILAALVLALYAVPYLLDIQPFHNDLYGKYLSDKRTLSDGSQSLQGADTALEYKIKLLQLIVVFIGVSGFLLGFWVSRRENRRAAYLKLVEGQITLIQDLMSNERLMKAVDGIDRMTFKPGSLPGNQLKDADFLWCHLSKSMVIWEQLFMFRIKGWIDRKTWQYWDRQLREVMIGQRCAFEYPYEEEGAAPAGRERYAASAKHYADKWAVLFREWWHERQNYRYYHIDFVTYVYSILDEVRAGRETQSYLKENKIAGR